MTELVLGLGWFVSQMFLAVWVNKAKPPKTILAKYPKHVLLQYGIPLLYKWRSRIDKEDLPIIEEHRRRHLIQVYYGFLLPVILIYAYLYYLYIAI